MTWEGGALRIKTKRDFRLRRRPPKKKEIQVHRDLFILPVPHGWCRILILLLSWLRCLVFYMYGQNLVLQSPVFLSCVLLVLSPCPCSLDLNSCLSLRVEVGRTLTADVLLYYCTPGPGMRPLRYPPTPLREEHRFILFTFLACT